MTPNDGRRGPRGPWASRLALVTLLGLAGWAAVSYVEGGLIAVILRSDVAAADRIEQLRELFASLGMVAPLAYVAIVIVEVVVAPIPGTVLYAPAGVIFGGFWGGILSLAGNVVGAALSFLLMRALGRSAFERFIAAEHLDAVERRVVERGSLIVFLLRVNPLTSSDLVSYAAGATSMPLRTLLWGTTLGMAPLCFLQSYLAEGLLAAFPRLIYPLLVAGLIYALLFVWIICKAIGGSEPGHVGISPRSAVPPSDRRG